MVSASGGGGGGEGTGNDGKALEVGSVTRVIIGGQLLTVVALFAIRSMVRRRTKRAIMPEKVRPYSERHRARAASSSKH